MNHHQQTVLAFDVHDHGDTTRLAATSPTPAVDRSDTSHARPGHSRRPGEPRPSAPVGARRPRPARKHTLAAFPHGKPAALRGEPGDPGPAPLLLTIPDAGRLLGLGRTTMYELIGAGEVEVVHIGRAARVPIDSIVRYVERLRSVSHPGR